MRPLAHASVTRLHGILSALLHAGEIAELVPTVVTRKVKLPRRNEPQREIRAWSDEQVTAFLAHPATAASPLRSIFIAVFSTGMRRSELLGLTPADLRLNVGQAASVRAPVAAPGRRRRRAEVGPVSAAAAAVAGHRPRPMPCAKPSPTSPTHRSAHLDSGWIPSRVCRSRRTR